MIHRLSLRIAISVGLASALAACGGDDAAVTLDDFPSAYEDAVCENLVRCGRFEDEATCKATIELNLDEAFIGLDEGRTAYDADKAGACLASLRSGSCDSAGADNRLPQPACEATFHGTVVDGGQCFDDDECLSTSCEIADCGLACCAGVCDPTVALAAIGASCASADCVEGAFCTEADVCQAYIAAGQSCSGSSCGYGLFCSEASICTATPKHGEACPDGRCANIGDQCGGSASAPTCVSLSGRGEACPGGFAGLFACQSPLTCDSTALTCQDPPAIGAACTFVCATGAFCNDTDVCEAERANGAECDGDSDCASDFCNEEVATPVCATPVPCG